MFYQETDHMSWNGCKQTLADFVYSPYIYWIFRKFSPLNSAISFVYNLLIRVFAFETWTLFWTKNHFRVTAKLE